MPKAHDEGKGRKAQDSSSPSTAAGQAVEVSIGGRRFRIRSTDPESLRATALKVDHTLRLLTGHDEPVENFKVALLAALNIAAEQEETRAVLHERVSTLHRRSREVEARLTALAEKVAH